MDSTRNISLVFGFIIVILIWLGGVSLYFMEVVSENTEKIYNHPYAVSNAARDINTNLVSMLRSVKDIVLAEDDEQVRNASRTLDVLEHEILDDFDLIFDRYLGEASDIETAHTAFKEWEAIRDRVVELKLEGKDKEAADVTKNEGAEYVAFLSSEIQIMITFADNKAKDFLKYSRKAKNNALMIIAIFLSVAVLVSLVAAHFGVKRLKEAQKEIKTRLHLIDQNILMARLDTKANILDITNELCRYLGETKSELIGQPGNFFITKGHGTIKPEEILKIASSGKAWEGDIHRLSAAGDSQWIYSSVLPDLDENYIINGYTNIISDITDRKAIEELSITDNMTNLYNRRHYDDVIEREIKIARRQDTYLALAIVDVDYFKKYNDHYGHPEGDTVLIKVAQTLKQALNRPNDYVFRLGGEEFGLLFSDLDAEHAMEFLDNIRSAVENLKIKHDYSDVNEWLTISTGASLYKGSNIPDGHQLYVAADAALYKAKEQRNNVVLT